MEQFERQNLLLGTESTTILNSSCVAIFGCGGVGGYVIESLARCGIKEFILIDNDVFSMSNINRQILATHNTVGLSKVLVAKQRILDINPNAEVITYETFVLKDNINTINLDNCDFIVDAIDNITGKISIIEKAKSLDIPVISCMGTGNKLDPSLFKIVDISKTTVCPLAKVMRYELRKRNIKNVPVLFSTELPSKSNVINEQGKSVPGSIAFVPSVAGLLISRYVVLSLIKQKSE